MINVNEIFVNPYFHNRMLNLANLVTLTPERKLQFFSDTMAVLPRFCGSESLTVDNSGNLSDESQVMEVALILSKQNSSSPSTMAPVFAHSLAQNNVPAQKLALQQRVLNYYPELDYLFR